ncbi:MAG: ribonuclease HII [Acidobacteriota bacterium]
MIHITERMWLNPSALSIAEIRNRLLREDGPVPAHLLIQLEKDPRAGVRQLCRHLKRQQKERMQQRQRSEAMLRLEQKLWSSGVARIAGVDEVGVGPLAGPVVAASVVFEPGVNLPGVDDSKRIKPEDRERLEPKIREAATGVGVGVVGVEEIARLNVYNAGILAMRRAVEQLPTAPEHLLLDAREIPGISIPQSSFIKGDRLSLSIAAASIIAKTYRDRIMIDLDRIYPLYGFAQHKGYGTPAHMRAIKEHGPSVVHRTSFAVIQEICGEYSALFYRLRSTLQSAASDRDIGAFEGEFGELRGELNPTERRKIVLLLARRKARRQPTLFGLQ